MASKDDILGQFQLYNIVPAADVIEKCFSICTTYNIDAEELVDQWIAYTSSNLRGAAPSVEHLEKMERKEYQKGKGQIASKLPTHRDQSVYGESSHQSTDLQSDVPGTPKTDRPTTSAIQTPVQSRKLIYEPLESSLSSPGAQTGNYSKRTNAKSIEIDHGPKGAAFVTQLNSVNVKLMFSDGLKGNQTFMYEILGKRGKSLDNMTEDIVIAICDKYNLNLTSENNKDDDMGKYMYAGRIVSDSEGKLNNQSVILEQTRRFHGKATHLNLSKAEKYSLFPGQVVAVESEFPIQTMGLKTQLFARRIFADSVFNLPPEPPVTKDPLQVVLACGPFTIQDTLTFEPLSDLLIYVKEQKPNVLVLASPFFERTNKAISNGELKQPFDTFFMELIDTVMYSLQGTDVKVVIASSQREPHHFPVYPTPPFEVREKYENLLFVPDPFLVDIDGLVIGGTTADILFHLSTFEMHVNNSNSGREDRMGRLASHLLEQQSFYPLDPPNKEMCIDMTLMERFGVMGVKPHILILPSNLRYFVKELSECVVINPERLTKGYGGGTFARIEVQTGNTTTVCHRTACQIMRI